MFDVLSGWIAEFIADMEARPFLAALLGNERSHVSAVAGCLAGGPGRAAALGAAEHAMSPPAARGLPPLSAVMPGDFMQRMLLLLQAHSAGTNRWYQRPCDASAAAARLRQQAGARADSRRGWRLPVSHFSTLTFTDPPPPDVSMSRSRRRWRMPRACLPPRRRPPRARAPRSAAAAHRRPPPRLRPGQAPAPQVPGRPRAVRARGLHCPPAGLCSCCKCGNAGVAAVHRNDSWMLSQRPGSHESSAWYQRHMLGMGAARCAAHPEQPARRAPDDGEDPLAGPRGGRQRAHLRAPEPLEGRHARARCAAARPLSASVLMPDRARQTVRLRRPGWRIRVQTVLNPVASLLRGSLWGFCT